MRIAALCFLAALFPARALADAVPLGQEGELGRILKPDPHSQACFRRDYDQKHLAAHPKQTVTSMELRLVCFSHEPNAEFPEGQRNYYFDLIVKRRGNDKEGSVVGECGNRSKGIFCGVDCDGGGFYLKRTQGEKSVVVDFGDMWGIRLANGCGEDEADTTTLEPGTDDKSFRLDPSAAACPVFEDW